MPPPYLPGAHEYEEEAGHHQLLKLSAYGDDECSSQERMLDSLNAKGMKAKKQAKKSPVKASKTALLYRPLTVAAIVRALVARSSLCADTAGLAAEEAVRVRAGRSGGLRFVRGLPSFDRRCPAREERFIIADRLALPLSYYCGPFSRLVID